MRGTVGRGGTSLDNQSYHRSKSKARVSRGLAQGGGMGSALHDIRQIRLRDDPTGLRQRQWDEVVVDGRLVVCRKKHGEATRRALRLVSNRLTQCSGVTPRIAHGPPTPSRPRRTIGPGSSLVLQIPLSYMIHSMSYAS